MNRRSHTVEESESAPHFPVTVGRWPALVLLLVATGIAALNFYLAMIRPLIFQRRLGYRNVSGIPLVGSLLVVLATLLAFGSMLCGVLGLVAVLLDTGGSLWFVVATWRDSSLWDRRE